MGNCLKTQLKEVVNNTNIPILSAMKISVVSDYAENNAMFYIINPSSAVIIRCRDGQNHLVVNGSNKSEHTINTDEEARIELENGNYIVDVIDGKKVSFNRFQLSATDGSDTHKIKASLEDIVYKGQDLAQTIVLHADISGNIALLSNCKETQTLLISDSNITGDISVIGNMKELTSLNIQNSKISGTVERLVAEWTSGPNPKTISSPMLISGLLYQCSFGIRPAKVDGSGSYLTFNNDGSKIAVYYGSWSGWANCSTVYIKGYKNDGTDSEYNTNVASGGIWENKTVIDADTNTTWHTPA